jgi:hypothetical protein
LIANRKTVLQKTLVIGRPKVKLCTKTIRQIDFKKKGEWNRKTVCMRRVKTTKEKLFPKKKKSKRALGIKKVVVGKLKAQETERQLREKSKAVSITTRPCSREQ